MTLALRLQGLNEIHSSGGGGVERYGTAPNINVPRNGRSDQRPAVQCGLDKTDAVNPQRQVINQHAPSRSLLPIGHALYASDVIESVNAAQRECEKLSEAHLANDLSAVQMACAEIDRLTRHASEIAKAYNGRVAQYRLREPRVR